MENRLRMFDSQVVCRMWSKTEVHELLLIIKAWHDETCCWHVDREVLKWSILVLLQRFTVPQSWFIHFYVLGTMVNTALLLVVLLFAYACTFPVSERESPFSIMMAQMGGTLPVSGSPLHLFWEGQEALWLHLWLCPHVSLKWLDLSCKFSLQSTADLN
jgi:hypothetical protein